MQRRQFIALIGGAAAWPLTARGQPRAKTPKIGVLWHAGSAEEEAIYLGELRNGLSGLGYIDGKTIALEHRFPNEQPERFLSLAAELAALKPDVLIAVTQQAAVAAQRATTTIPIVFIVVPDPVGVKLVDSLSRPGGNITGLTHIAVELSGKRLAVFKEAFPRMTRVALLVNANNAQTTKRYIDETQTAATGLGLDVRPVEVRALTDFDQAFDRIVDGRLEGVAVPADPLFYQGRSLMAQAAITRRLPLMAYSRETLERARSCPMGQINAESSAELQSMSTKFSTARKQLTCRLSSRPNLNSSLTTGLRKQSDTRFRSCFYFERTR